MIENDFYLEESELTLEEIIKTLDEFEKTYGMTSREFYEKWKHGKTDWVAESVVWSGMFEAYQTLNGENQTSKAIIKNQ